VEQEVGGSSPPNCINENCTNEISYLASFASGLRLDLAGHWRPFALMPLLRAKGCRDETGTMLVQGGEAARLRQACRGFAQSGVTRSRTGGGIAENRI
jgi:hypothetical protein